MQDEFIRLGTALKHLVHTKRTLLGALSDSAFTEALDEASSAADELADVTAEVATERAPCFTVVGEKLVCSTC